MNAAKEQPVLIERNGPVIVISINRPDRRNAVDGATARQLYDAFLAFDSDSNASVQCWRERMVHSAPAPICTASRPEIGRRFSMSVATIRSLRWNQPA